MLSLATTPLSFAGPSAIASRSRAADISMETPPVFSEVDEEKRGYYRTPSETAAEFNPNAFVQTLPGITDVRMWASNPRPRFPWDLRNPYPCLSSLTSCVRSPHLAAARVL